MLLDLFSLHSEIVFTSIDKLEGMEFCGVNTNSIRFVDDTVLIAKSERNLEKLIQAIQKQFEHLEMQIKTQKN